MFVKSSEAARRVGITCTRLYSLLRNGKLKPPRKDTSGDYFWGEEDVRRLREAVRAAGRKNA